MIELLMALSLTGILAVAASLVLFGGKAAFTVPALAAKIRDDIRYTQALAMSGTKLGVSSAAAPVFRYRMRFNVADANCPGAGQYTIVNDADYNGAWGENPNASGVVESGRNPSDGAPYFCVKLNTGNYAGLTASASFGATVGDARILEFDNYGVPYNDDGRMLSAGTVTISGGAQAATVTVAPNTGSVTVQ
ncbi:MAG: hypothetical protein HY894_01355 [Deltaproteobacteria bacterium]|nr:hypothetical protein [Deltaproteobacteria bacterium]